MKKFILLSLILLFSFQHTLAQKHPKRDLSLYDDGGTFDFSWRVGPKKHEEMKPKVREFIWNHWKDKKRGVVTTIYYSFEADPWLTTYYIEPDKKGGWVISYRYKSSCCNTDLLTHPTKRPVTTVSYGIYTGIERLESMNIVVPPGVKLTRVAESMKTIPSDEVRKPDSYMIRLFERSGSSEIL